MRLVSVVVTCLSLRLLSAPQSPELSALLESAATYVAQYEEQVSAIVFQEDYEQRVTRLPNSFQERWLKSEILVLNTADLGWVGFRDVFEVDGKSVSERQNRLQKLFVNSGSDGVVARARGVTAESARFNLGSVGRDLNYPTMALMILRRAHQGRSTFSIQGREVLNGTPTIILGFREERRPTLLSTRENGTRSDLPASGRFWIEPKSGRVWRSQLTVELEHATGIYDVRYGTWAGLDVLMPTSMEENLSVRSSGQRSAASIGDIRPIEVLRGRARYSGFKRFTVTTEDHVAPVK
jgi:hypothetical protein